MRIANAGRALLTMASQSLSSVTNFLVAAFALQAGTLVEFGHFSVVFQLCQLVIIVGQGAIGSMVLIHASSDPHGQRSRDIRDGAAGAAIVVGAAAGAIFAVAAFVVDGDLRTMLLLAAVGSPGLVAQYVLRAQRFAVGDPLGALAADCVWLAAVAVAGTLDVFGVWDLDPAGHFAVWLGGGAISSVPIFVTAFGRGFARLRVFWQVVGRQAIHLSVEAGMARIVFVTSLVTAQALLGPEASGVVAAAVLTLSPMSVIHEAISVIVVPARVRRDGIHVLDSRTVTALSTAVVAMTVAWFVVVLILNESDLRLGPFDLDRNDIPFAVFAATGARFVMLAAWRGPLIALRIADASVESLRSRAIGTVAQVVLPVIGFALGVAWGVAGLAIGTAIGAAAAAREWSRLDGESIRSTAAAGAST